MSFVVLFLFAATAVPAASPGAKAGPTAETDALVGKIVHAYGGKDALSKVRSIYARGYARLYQVDNDGWVTRYLRYPGNLRVEARYHNSPETRVMNGAKGWTGVGTARGKEADRYAYEGLIFQYNYLYLPFFLAEGRKGIVYKGKDKAAGAPVDVLQIKDMNGLDMTVYVDQGTHLVSRVSSTLTNGSTRAEVAVEFFDYRDTGSVKVPFRVVNRHGADPVSETRMYQVVFNQPMDDKLFQP